MITEVFENLFEPVSDSELHARMEDNFKLVNQFETEWKSIDTNEQGYAIERGDLVRSYYEKYPDMEWEDIEDELFFGLRTSEHAMMTLYYDWKKTKQVEDMIKRNNDNRSV